MEGSLKYELVNQIAVIDDDGKWKLELNRISWNGKEPRYDLRKWSPDHSKMSKGITFSEKEMLKLCEALNAEKAKIENED